MLRNLAPALALFFRQAWQTLAFQPKLVGYVRFRCQHCDRQIRRDTIAGLYIDGDGILVCGGTGGMVMHRPMPAIRQEGDDAE